MALPKFLQSALYSYDLESLDIQRDYRLITAQILNHGNWQQVQWLQKTYDLEKIKQVVKKPARGVWHNDVLNYWQTVLEIKIPKKYFDQALFSLNPR